MQEASVRKPHLIARSTGQTIDADDTLEELSERVSRAPSSALIRGMFPAQLMEGAPPGISKQRFVSFKLYPVRDYMQLLLEVAKAKYPRQPVATGLLRLGYGVYPLFASSVAGTAVFAAVQYDFKVICEMAPKAYNITLKPGSVAVDYVRDGEARIKLRNVWPFPDIFHAGIWLGAMKVCRTSGTVEVTKHSDCNVDFVLRWQT